MVRIKQLIILIGLMEGSYAFAQSDRYMVFFSDKDQVAYSLENPESFLSERSIARRAKMGIAVTSEDLPVDPQYVDQVRTVGAEVYFTTNWLNGVLTEMTAQTATEVGNLSFVDRVVYVAPGTKLTHTPGDYTIADTFTEPARVESTTVVQNAMLGVDALHADGFRGEGMLIAVFDDGFQGVNQYQPFEHLFDEGKLLSTRDFVSNSGNVFQYDDHGTSVLSCIGQYYGENYIGTAPNADFVLCVTEDLRSEYRIEEYNWLFAAEFADSLGVDVINGSLGYFSFSDSSMDYVYEDMDGETTVVARAAQMASDRGIVVVVSAGNEGNNSWRYITSPADASGVLAVGSVDTQRQVSVFSSEGPAADGRVKPDVAALGSFATVFYTSGNGEISTRNGTSFSSPQVAGLVAGLWQANPTWTSEEVIQEMKSMASRANDPDFEMGYGIPRYKSLNNPLAVDEDDEIRVYPNPFKDNVVTIDLGNLQIGNRLEIKVIDHLGKQVYWKKLASKEIDGNLELVLDQLQSGTYFFTLRSRRLKKTVKLIKIK